MRLSACYYIASTWFCLTMCACSSGKALTPKQQKEYDELSIKYQEMGKERVQLQQRLEEQFRANSKQETTTKSVVKEIAACNVQGVNAKLNLQTFKKHPSLLGFTQGGQGKSGCDGLKPKIK